LPRSTGSEDFAVTTAESLHGEGARWVFLTKRGPTNVLVALFVSRTGLTQTRGFRGEIVSLEMPKSASRTDSLKGLQQTLSHYRGEISVEGLPTPPEGWQLYNRATQQFN